MPDWLPEGVSSFGLIVLLVTVFVAGVVYGFAGFGAALIFLPVAARVVPLEVAIAAFNLSAVASLVTVVPKAWKQVDRRAVWVQILCACLSASAGIFVLRTVDVTWLKWAMVLLIAATLIALIAGWRLKAEPTLRMRGYVGLLAGFFGGAVGLLGPAVVIFQLAGTESAARSRATTLVFLTVSSVLILPLMAAQGLITWAVVPLGLAMLVPYGLGTQVGHWLFRPQFEGLYRGAAYALIALAVLLGLPLDT
ncbi:sulfite exporter TauE/SafE family protein [Pseudooceanicola onchidii]|uniref:sulfite exporter TauE/SafE family protein n=1 Tax=Pseudooceanicola onchidii TaxID=2562279 RepID=UPI0010AA996F|nr:sulfite exporter TauE/SafE family protein [Pseudooceanicola onchidii]